MQLLIKKYLLLKKQITNFEIVHYYLETLENNEIYT